MTTLLAQGVLLNLAYLTTWSSANSIDIAVIVLCDVVDVLGDDETCCSMVVVGNSLSVGAWVDYLVRCEVANILEGNIVDIGGIE